MDMRVVCPLDVKKLLLKQARMAYWKKWASTNVKNQVPDVRTSDVEHLLIGTTEPFTMVLHGLGSAPRLRLGAWRCLPWHSVVQTLTTLTTRRVKMNGNLRAILAVPLGSQPFDSWPHPPCPCATKGEQNTA